MILDIAVPLLAGLAMFLFGMKMMELALNTWASPFLKTGLEKFTETPWKGMLTGIGVTALIQSSSATIAILIGLVNAGVLTLNRTLGIILGTNIGTCVTLEFISLPIHRAALPLFVSAAACWLLTWFHSIQRFPFFAGGKGRAIRYFSLALAGFACLLMGMEIMQTIAVPLKKVGLFNWFVEQAQQNLVWGVAAGAGLTAIIQSSTAAIAIAMGLTSFHLMTGELGVAFVLGANVGTCVTAFLAAIGTNPSAKLVAWIQLMLNLFGVLLFFPWISHLYQLSAFLSSQPSMQLAHAQTLFNIICSLLALPLCYLPFFNKPRFLSNRS